MPRVRKRESVLSDAFYMRRLKEIGRDPEKILRSSKIIPGVPRSNQSIGKMFMYGYDAKTKEDLKWWDRLPLIIYLRSYPDGFLGLNLHYFPISVRIKLFEAVLPIKTYKIPGQAKLNLKAIEHFPGAKFGLKRYLTSHVQSRVLYVHPSDWIDTVYLPLADFQKQSKYRVWAAYRRHYGG